MEVIFKKKVGRDLKKSDTNHTLAAMGEKIGHGLKQIMEEDIQRNNLFGEMTELLSKKQKAEIINQLPSEKRLTIIQKLLEQSES